MDHANVSLPTAWSAVPRLPRPMVVRLPQTANQGYEKPMYSCMKTQVSPDISHASNKRRTQNKEETSSVSQQNMEPSDLIYGGYKNNCCSRISSQGTLPGNWDTAPTLVDLLKPSSEGGRAVVLERDHSIDSGISDLSDKEEDSTKSNSPRSTANQCQPVYPCATTTPRPPCTVTTIYSQAHAYVSTGFPSDNKFSTSRVHFVSSSLDGGSQCNSYFPSNYAPPYTGQRQQIVYPSGMIAPSDKSGNYIQQNCGASSISNRPSQPVTCRTSSSDPLLAMHQISSCINSTIKSIQRLGTVCKSSESQHLPHSDSRASLCNYVGTAGNQAAPNRKRGNEEEFSAAGTCVDSSESMNFRSMYGVLPKKRRLMCEKSENAPGNIAYSCTRQENPPKSNNFCAPKNVDNLGHMANSSRNTVTLMNAKDNCSTGDGSATNPNAQFQNTLKPCEAYVSNCAGMDGGCNLPFHSVLPTDGFRSSQYNSNAVFSEASIYPLEYAHSRFGDSQKGLIDGATVGHNEDDRSLQGYKSANVYQQSSVRHSLGVHLKKRQDYTQASNSHPTLYHHEKSAQTTNNLQTGVITNAWRNDNGTQSVYYQGFRPLLIGGKLTSSPTMQTQQMLPANNIKAQVLPSFKNAKGPIFLNRTGTPTLLPPCEANTSRLTEPQSQCTKYDSNLVHFARGGRSNLNVGQLSPGKRGKIKTKNLVPDNVFVRAAERRKRQQNLPSPESLSAYESPPLQNFRENDSTEVHVDNCAAVPTSRQIALENGTTATTGSNNATKGQLIITDPTSLNVIGKSPVFTGNPCSLRLPSIPPAKHTSVDLNTRHPQTSQFFSNMPNFETPTLINSWSPPEAEKEIFVNRLVEQACAMRGSRKQNTGDQNKKNKVEHLNTYSLIGRKSRSNVTVQPVNTPKISVQGEVKRDSFQQYPTFENSTITNDGNFKGSSMREAENRPLQPASNANEDKNLEQIGAEGPTEEDISKHDGPNIVESVALANVSGAISLFDSMVQDEVYEVPDIVYEVIVSERSGVLDKSCGKCKEQTTLETNFSPGSYNISPEKDNFVSCTVGDVKELKEMSCGMESYIPSITSPTKSDIHEESKSGIGWHGTEVEVVTTSCYNPQTFASREDVVPSDTFEKQYTAEETTKASVSSCVAVAENDDSYTNAIHGIVSSHSKQTHSEPNPRDGPGQSDHKPQSVQRYMEREKKVSLPVQIDKEDSQMNAVDNGIMKTNECNFVGDGDGPAQQMKSDLESLTQCQPLSSSKLKTLVSEGTDYFLTSDKSEQVKNETQTGEPISGETTEVMTGRLGSLEQNIPDSFGSVEHKMANEIDVAKSTPKNEPTRQSSENDGSDIRLNKTFTPEVVSTKQIAEELSCATILNMDEATKEGTDPSEFGGGTHQSDCPGGKTSSGIAKPIHIRQYNSNSSNCFNQLMEKQNVPCLPLTMDRFDPTEVGGIHSTSKTQELYVEETVKEQLSKTAIPMQESINSSDRPKSNRKRLSPVSHLKQTKGVDTNRFDYTNSELIKVRKWGVQNVKTNLDPVVLLPRCDAKYKQRNKQDVETFQTKAIENKYTTLPAAGVVGNSCGSEVTGQVTCHDCSSRSKDAIERSEPVECLKSLNTERDRSTESELHTCTEEVNDDKQDSIKSRYTHEDEPVVMPELLRYKDSVSPLHSSSLEPPILEKEYTEDGPPADVCAFTSNNKEYYETVRSICEAGDEFRKAVIRSNGLHNVTLEKCHRKRAFSATEKSDDVIGIHSDEEISCDIARDVLRDYSYNENRRTRYPGTQNIFEKIAGTDILEVIRNYGIEEKCEKSEGVTLQHSPSYVKFMGEGNSSQLVPNAPHNAALPTSPASEVSSDSIHSVYDVDTDVETFSNEPQPDDASTDRYDDDYHENYQTTVCLHDSGSGDDPLSYSQMSPFQTPGASIFGDGESVNYKHLVSSCEVRLYDLKAVLNGRTFVTLSKDFLSRTIQRTNQMTMTRMVKEALEFKPPEVVTLEHQEERIRSLKLRLTQLQSQYKKISQVWK